MTGLSDASGITDSIEVEVIKGPDPAEWDGHARLERGAAQTDDDGEPILVKGPAEEQWGAEARAERGCVDSNEVPPVVEE